MVKLRWSNWSIGIEQIQVSWDRNKYFLRNSGSPLSLEIDPRIQFLGDFFLDATNAALTQTSSTDLSFKRTCSRILYRLSVRFQILSYNSVEPSFDKLGQHRLLNLLLVQCLCSTTSKCKKQSLCIKQRPILRWIC